MIHFFELCNGITLNLLFVYQKGLNLIKCLSVMHSSKNSFKSSEESAFSAVKMFLRQGVSLRWWRGDRLLAYEVYLEEIVLANFADCCAIWIGIGCALIEHPLSGAYIFMLFYRNIGIESKLTLMSLLSKRSLNPWHACRHWDY